MPDWVQELVHYGPLGLFALAVCYALWKMLVYVGHKLFDDDKGLVPRWVEGEMRWRGTLTERLEKQQHACDQHVETLSSLNEILKDQVEVTSIAMVWPPCWKAEWIIWQPRGSTA